MWKQRGEGHNMCGLAGYITDKKYSREAQAKFEKILLEAEVRGTDACGIGFVAEKGRFYYAKAPKKASEFIAEQGFKDLIKEHNPTILIGHNRAKTQGDQANNVNNHPVVTKSGLILIHNGILYNEDEITKEFNLSLDGEVDSEVIVKLIEYYIHAQKKNTIKAIQLMRKHIRGTIAIALLNANEPKTLYLLASSNPINLAYHIPTGTIYFASTEDILKRGLIEYDTYFGGLFIKERGESDYIFEEVEDNTGLKISQKGWTRFEVETPTTITTYSGGHSGRYNEYDEDGYPITKNTGQYKVVPSAKPVIIEGKTEDDIIEALKGYSGFDADEAIDKPSAYLSPLLLYRLDMIQDQFVSGDYLMWYTDPKNTGKEYLELETEVKRIINTLESRAKITGRKDIIIPKLEDVFLLKNDRYKKVLETAEPDAEGFESLQYILTRNPKAMEWLRKADKFADEKGKLLDKLEEEELTAEERQMEEDMDRNSPEPGPDYYECLGCRQKVFETPCPYCHEEAVPIMHGKDDLDYYCPECCTLKSQNICLECGTINLKRVEDHLEENRERQLALNS
jgi:hypothetical protein